MAVVSIRRVTLALMALQGSGFLFIHAVAVTGPQLVASGVTSAPGLGELVSAYAFGGFAGLAVSGGAISRIRLSVVVMAGSALGSTCIVAGFAGDHFTRLALLAVGGFGWGLTTTAGATAALLSAPPGRRGLASGLRLLGLPIAGAIAGVAFPPLASRFGLWAPFLVSALAWFTVGVVAGRLVAPLDVHLDPDAGARPGGRAILLGIVGALFAGVQWAFSVYLGLELVVRGRYEVAVAGVVYALVQGAAIVGRVSNGYLSDRWQGHRLAALGVIGLVGAAGLVGWSAAVTGPALAMVGFAIVAGLTIMAWNAVLAAAIGESGPPARAGANMAAGLAVTRIGELAMPVVFGLALLHGGSPTAWFGLAAVLATAAGAAFIADAHWQHRDASWDPAPGPR
jgi:hypothetical protein